jgi:protein involved in polysaccharide export with SLBB domain
MSIQVGETADLFVNARRRSVWPEKLSAMTRVLSTIAFLLIAQTVATAQTTDSSSSRQTAASESAAVRTRTVGPKVSNHADGQKSRSARAAEDNGVPKDNAENSPAQWGNTAVAITAPRANTTMESANNLPLSPGPFLKPPVLPASLPTAEVKSRVAVPSASEAPASYDVGIGDVLDVRLPETSTRESTLFTVLKNGTIEYPLLAAPISVAGMTTDEIAKALTAQIRVIKTAGIKVSVRDYASHAVLITGLVDNPGRQVLRRQAMPLYAVLAQASARAEATTVTILHDGKEGPPFSLHDEKAMAALISAGDVVKVSGGTAPTQFVYVGGKVASPGEKSFREGMTLTQILLASGASPATISTARIARRTGAGLLSTNDYDLRSIEQGKMPDPFLEPGDRIEVTHPF